MAEFEEIAEVLDEAEDGIAEEAEEAEDLDPEEKEELEKDVAEAKESVSRLRQVVDAMKEISVTQVLKSFSVFVAKNAAIGAVFYGVTVALKKIFGSSESGSSASADAEQKLAKTQAISTLITDESTISQTLSDWLKEHEDETITVSDIEVPLTDIFYKYTKEMASVSCTQFHGHYAVDSTIFVIIIELGHCLHNITGADAKRRLRKYYISNSNNRSSDHHCQQL